VQDSGALISAYDVMYSWECLGASDISLQCCHVVDGMDRSVSFLFVAMLGRSVAGI